MSVLDMVQAIKDQISGLWRRIAELDELISDLTTTIKEQSDAYDQIGLSRDSLRTNLTQNADRARGRADSFSSRALQMAFKELIAKGDKICEEQDAEIGSILTQCQDEINANDGKKQSYQTERNTLGNEISRLNASLSTYGEE